MGGAGVFQAAEGVAVARVDLQDAVEGLLRLLVILQLHVGVGQRIQDRLVLLVHLAAGLDLGGERFVGKGAKLGITELGAGLTDDHVGLVLVGIERQHLLGQGELLGRFLLPRGGKLHRGAADLHAEHLFLE